MTREQMIRMLVAANGGSVIFRPSSISRVINCKGSIQMTAKAPKERKSSFAAREGTAAHAVGEDCLRTGRHPEEWVGRKIVTHDDPQGFYLESDIGTDLPMYINEINDRREPGTTMLLEQKFSLESLDPTDPIMAQNKGTTDCCIINPYRRKLSIIDLKWGRGVMVAGDTPQVKDYALLALLNIQAPPGGWAEVETVVVQPRAADDKQRVKPFIFHPEEILTDFMGLLLGAMNESLEPDAPLTPDPTGGYCRWCPAAAICPALREFAISIGQFGPTEQISRISVDSALGPLPQQVLIGEIIPPVPANALVLPKSVDLNPAEVSLILKQRALFETWISSIEQRAVQMLEAGIDIPDWKLVQRTGNRRYRDQTALELPEWFSIWCKQYQIDVNKIDAATVLAALGAKQKDMYTAPKLKSPAQIEKLLPTKDRHLLEFLFERPLGNATLVQGSDTRKALESALGPI